MRAISRSFYSILIATALTAATLPAIAAECKALQRVTSLDLKDLPSGRMGVTAAIADRPETLLVDTGGAISQLTRKTVQELNLTPTRGDPTRGRVGLRGVNGALSDQQVRLPSITLGGFRQEGAYFFVAPDTNPNDNRSPEFAGILAPDFLQHFDADFDFAAHKLNLFSPDHCPGLVVYWQAPTVAVVPFNLEKGDHISFPMELDGKKVNAVLDTGAARTILNLTIAQRIFGVDVNAPDVEKVGQLNGGFSAAVYRRRFKTLSVQAVTVVNPMVFLLPDLVTGAVRQGPATGSLIGDHGGLPDVLLGMPTLSQLHVYIAYKERKLYITVSNTAPASRPAQAQNASFCPSPAEPQSEATPAPATPSVGAGMAAFRNKNYPLAYANLRPLADMGNVEAARDLGIVLRQSCETKGDKSAAVAWLQKAADAGDVEASAELGNMYMFGDGVAQDDAAAVKQLTVAATAGHTVSQANLGELYFTGRGVAQDRYQGIVWSVRAGEKGGPVALIHIGREYGNGLALPKDNAKAMLFMTVGIQRLPPPRRNQFQPALDTIVRQMSADAVKTIQQNAQKWAPGQGKLSDVLADADKQRGH
jgi:predicted aspartyl protease